MDEILNAVVARLRAALTLGELECDKTPDGKPHPTAGQRFVAVHPGNVTNNQKHCLDEYYSFKATVTVRTGMDPRDRIGDGGAWALALRVRAVIHMKPEIPVTLGVADPTFQVTEFPVFRSGSYIGPVGPDWFWAEGVEPAPTGIAVALNFDGIRRIQYIDEQSE